MIIFRYLAKQVLTTMVAVTFVLLMVFMSGRFIKYLAKAASGGISPDVLLSIMLYRLPGFLELILPLGFFIGVLLAYGRMYLESEMTVLHACGLSQRRLTALTMGMSLFVALIVGWLSLFVTPWGMQKVENIFDQQAQMTEFEMLFPGKFQRLKSGDRVTYAESLSEDKRVMYNVFISENSGEEGELQFLYAESGTQLVDDETGARFLVLHNGTRTQGSPGDPQFNQLEFASYGVKIDEPDAESRSVKEESIPSTELLVSDDAQYKALLQWRLSLPILLPIVTLIAISVCRVNPRQGRYFHLFPAMLIYVLYLGLLIVARKSVAKDASLPLGLWGVHLTFLCLSIILIYRDKLFDMIMPKKSTG